MTIPDSPDSTGAPIFLSDAELLRWLASRSYVEATNRGYEDPARFECHRQANVAAFRARLSAHIIKHKRGKRR